MFLPLFSEELHRILPNDVSHLLIQCIAGTLGGFTTTLLTNPLDIVRARLQVSITVNFFFEYTEVWEVWEFLLML